MFDQSPFLGGGCLETSQNLLVQAILALEEANTTHQTSTKSPSSRKPSSNETSPIIKNVKTALDRLSKLYILLFGPQCSEDSHSFSRWITQNRRVLNGILGENADLSASKVLDIVLGDEASCGEGVIEIVKDADAESSPPQRCDILLPYQPSLNLNDELKQFRKLAERRFESTPDGIPRVIVEKVAALELLFYLTRDQTTDCVWNVDHQASRIEVFAESDVGKVFRQKCVCTAAAGSEEKVHSTDPHCPKNKKDEDSRLSAYVSTNFTNKFPAPVKVEVKDKPEEKKEEKKEEEKVDPSEKIHSRELMAEILDMIGPQHVKDHFRKIKDVVSASYKEKDPWEGKYFGVVLMGPASTGKFILHFSGLH